MRVFGFFLLVQKETAAARSGALGFTAAKKENIKP